MSTVKASPAVPVWTEAKRAKAETEFKYIKIDKPGFLLLTGALKKWKETPSFIYLPSLRIAGESEISNANGSTSYPIFEFLKKQGIDDNKAGELIANAYSLESVVGTAPAPYEEDKLNGRLVSQFKAELEKQKQNKKSTPKKVNNITLADINTIGAAIKTAVKLPKKASAPKNSKTGGSHKVPYIKRLIKLPTDKVLDVSSVGVNKPAKSIPVPKSSTNTKYGVNVQLFDDEQKQNVSRGVYSNNAESLKLVLEQLYPGETTTINTYLTSWHTAKANATTIKAPTLNGNVSVISNPVISTTNIPAPIFNNGISSPAAQQMSAMFGAPK